jgi:23S rRNA-intervening sequence protein
VQRTPARSFQDLIVWQKAHQLVLRVYKLTKSFPKEEIYGLARVLNIAQSSLEEVRYYFILAKDLNYLPGNTPVEDVEEVARLLGAYTSTLRSSDS